MSCLFEALHCPEDLQNHIKRCGWKEKLAFYRTLEKELSSQSLTLPVRVLSPCWPELLKETNLNALERVVACLKAYVQHYSIQNLRLKREIVNGVISLARMARPSINSNIVEIVITLIQQEQTQDRQVQRVPFGVISDPLHNDRQPTFLPGTTFLTDEDEEAYQEHGQLAFDSNSMLLGVLVENMRGCRKQAFSICQQVITKLQENSLLAARQLSELEEVIRVLNGVMTGQTENPQDYSSDSIDPATSQMGQSLTVGSDN